MEGAADVAGAGDDDLAAARAALAFLKRSATDLDSHLTASQRAECAAFSSLVEARLEPATRHSTWAEAQGFAEHSKVGGET